MSVYLVKDEHISILVAAAIAWQNPSPVRWVANNKHGVATESTAQDTAEMLHWANRKSVEFNWKEWPDVEEIVYHSPDGMPDAVYILNALSGFEYQTCETPGYATSEARAFVEALRARAIRELPGMKSAPWSVDSLGDWSTAADRRVKWVPNPQVIVQLNHGTSKSIVTGPVTLTFTQPNMIVVDTDAPVNTDAPGIMFRGNEYRAHLIMIRTHTGEWVDSDSRATIERRQMFGAEASPMARKAILAAVHAALVATWTPELDRAAAHAQAAQKLPGIADKYAAALATLRELDGQLAHTRETYNRTRPIDE